MSNQELAQVFHKLHIKGTPLILYNIWDAGSAEAVRDAGAKAIASGSHGVANAHGYADGEQIPLEMALEVTKQIAAVVDLPLTMDIETGYGETPDDVAATVKRVIEAGAVGINIEDQTLHPSGLRDATEQAERIKAAQLAAESAGVNLYINARSDIFRLAKPDQAPGDFMAETLHRAQAYADAGADGLFVPGLQDIELIRRLCKETTLNINILMLAGTPNALELAEAGVARISYGPRPYLEMIEWLKDKAMRATTEA